MAPDNDSHQNEIRFPGGSYRLEQQQDGTWTLRDLEIMGEMPIGAKGNQEPYNEEWMHRAISRHALRMKEGHLAPVHLRHNEDEKPDRPRIGFLMPTRVEKRQLDGRMQPVLLADIVRIEAKDLQLLRSMAFPYRSVELSRFHRDEISSLALLDSEAPFFRLPMLTNVSVVPRTFHASELRPLVSCCDAGDDGGAALFNFSEVRMSKEIQSLIDAAVAKFKDRAEKESGKLFASAVAKAKEEKWTEAKDLLEKAVLKLQEEDNKKPEKEPEKAQDNGGGTPAWASALLDLMSKIAAQVGVAAPAPGAPNMPMAPVEGSPAMKDDKAFAAMAARLLALEGKDKVRERESQVENLINVHLKDLREFAIDEDTARAKMREVAAASSDPEKALKAFSETLKTVALKDPPATLDAYTGRHTGRMADPPEVLKFADKGPDALERARRLSKQYSDLVSGGYKPSFTLEEFLKDQIAAEDRRLALR